MFSSSLACACAIRRGPLLLPQGWRLALGKEETKGRFKQFWPDVVSWWYSSSLPYHTVPCYSWRWVIIAFQVGSGLLYPQCQLPNLASLRHSPFQRQAHPFLIISSNPNKSTEPLINCSNTVCICTHLTIYETFFTYFCRYLHLSFLKYIIIIENCCWNNCCPIIWTGKLYE